MRFRIGAVLVASALLSGCALGPSGTRPDSGPAHEVDVSQVKDAVPRVEPRSRYGNPEYYEIAGRRYFVLNSAAGFKQRGRASWYGTKFDGRRTSSGELYNMYAMTAAHKTLPLPSYVQVTNLSNGLRVVVKVNDRGPFHGDRIIDLSYAAAKKLQFLQSGTAEVEIKALTPGVPEKTAVESYLVQVGAFVSRVSARQLAFKLQAKFRQIAQISALQTTRSLVYRVRLGPFLSRQTAVSWLARVQHNGFVRARMVTGSERWHKL